MLNTDRVQCFDVLGSDTKHPVVRVNGCTGNTITPRETMSEIEQLLNSAGVMYTVKRKVAVKRR